MVSRLTRGAERLHRFSGFGQAALFILTCILIAGLFAYDRNVGHRAAVKSCKRTNDVRREVNLAFRGTTINRNNVIDLSHAIATTRLLEAKVFGEFAVQGPFNQRSLIHLLQRRYAAAGKLDANISASETKIRLRRLELVDCNDRSVVP